MKILKPIITEKTMSDATKGKYTFKVAKASKPQIAQEIEKIFKVNVEKVNIINTKPEKKLIKGRFQATIKPYKKAIVTLKKGQKIEGYEVKE
jgi:large subunit ribosomal protein L23